MKGSILFPSYSVYRKVASVSMAKNISLYKICRAEYMRVISFPLWKYKTPRQWEGLFFSLQTLFSYKNALCIKHRDEIVFYGGSLFYLLFRHGVHWCKRQVLIYKSGENLRPFSPKGIINPLFSLYFSHKIYAFIVQKWLTR